MVLLEDETILRSPANMSCPPEVFTYVPSSEARKKYKDRLSKEPSPRNPPPGFPPEIKLRPRWSPTEIKDQEDQWLYRFTDDDLESIKKAVESFKGLFLVVTGLVSSIYMVPNSIRYLPGTGQTPQALTPATFPLSSSLRETLDKARRALYEGHGFRLFQGIKQDSYNRKERIIIHAGLTSYFGDTRGYVSPVPESTPVLGMHISPPNLKIYEYGRI